MKIRSEVGDQGIEFQPIPEWFIDEGNTVSYKILDNTKSGNGDWIGLYKEGFSSIDEYLVYEYINRGLGKMNFNIIKRNRNISGYNPICLHEV